MFSHTEFSTGTNFPHFYPLEKIPPTNQQKEQKRHKQLSMKLRITVHFLGTRPQHGRNSLSRGSGNGSRWSQWRRLEGNEIFLGWLICRGLDRAKTRALTWFSTSSLPFRSSLTPPPKTVRRCHRYSTLWSSRTTDDTDAKMSLG